MNVLPLWAHLSCDWPKPSWAGGDSRWLFRQSRPHGRESGGGAEARPADRADLNEALTGDKNAFSRLIERRERSLFGLALAVLGSREDAGDALQNGVVLAYSKLRALRDPTSFDSWLRRIVAREALAIARRRADGPVYVGFMTETAGATLRAGGSGVALGDGPAETSAARLDLAAALAELDDSHRTAVVLRYAGDMTVKEIARLTGVPGGTVKSRVHYGLKRLRELMSPDGRSQKGGGR